MGRTDRPEYPWISAFGLRLEVLLLNLTTKEKQSMPYPFKLPELG